MKPSSFFRYAAGVLLIGVLPQAFSADLGTDAGTDVNNRATVAYTVSTVTQTPIESSPTGNSNPGTGNGADTTFKTDRKVNLVVSEIGGQFTDVSPNAQDKALYFSVQNTTNDTIDILLTSTQDASGVTGPGGFVGPLTDDFQTSNVTFYLDNGNGVFEPGSGDTVITFLDDVPEDETRNVWLESDIPLIESNGSSLDDGDSSTHTLVAQAADTAGAPFVNSTGPDNPGAIDNVFADGDGISDDDRDGYHSDDDAYRVRTATLTVTKSTTVISDPINSTTNPKRIPGAIIEYCMVVTNTGSTAADSVSISDSLAGQPVTFLTGSIFAGGTNTCTGGTAEDDDATGTDDTPVTNTENAGNFTGSTVTTTVFTVPSSGSTSSRFRVTIQ